MTAFVFILLKCTLAPIPSSAAIYCHRIDASWMDRLFNLGTPLGGREKVSPVLNVVEALVK